jgi:hypothetical protein
MTELLEKTFAEYVTATLEDAPDVEAKYNTYAAVLENFIRELERA